MNNQNLAIRIKDLRNRKGFSQEQLSEESKLSLRTIQRIEKGESTPRGDTLIKLTQSLGVTPDDLLEFTDIEDKGYLTLMNLSALSILVQPLMGIIIPLAMWILKREKVKLVDDTGKKIINFQITWLLLLYTLFLAASKGRYIPYQFSVTDVIPLFWSGYDIFKLVVVILYIYSIAIILINVVRSQKGLKNMYFPAIPFLK